MDRTYTLTDLEAALRACDLAVIQTRRGQGGPIFTLEELKKAADALAGLVAKARAEHSHTLTLHDVGDLLPIGWLIGISQTPPRPHRQHE